MLGVRHSTWSAACGAALARFDQVSGSHTALGGCVTCAAGMGIARGGRGTCTAGPLIRFVCSSAARLSQCIRTNDLSRGACPRPDGLPRVVR